MNRTLKEYLRGMVASDILSGYGIDFYSLVLYKSQSLLADKTPKEGICDN